MSKISENSVGKTVACVSPFIPLTNNFDYGQVRERYTVAAYNIENDWVQLAELLPDVEWVNARRFELID